MSTHRRIDCTIWFSFISVNLRVFFPQVGIAFDAQRHSISTYADFHSDRNEFRAISSSKRNNINRRKHSFVFIWVMQVTWPLNAICHDCDRRPTKLKRLGLFCFFVRFPVDSCSLRLNAFDLSIIVGYYNLSWFRLGKDVRMSHSNSYSLNRFCFFILCFCFGFVVVVVVFRPTH